MPVSCPRYPKTPDCTHTDPRRPKKQIATLSPDRYTETDLSFIVPRVLELTFTATDITPWAEDLINQWKLDDGNWKPDTPEPIRRSPLAPFPFDPERRAELRAELDAYYARLYGLDRDELRYILDPEDVMGNDYPSETFRVLQAVLHARRRTLNNVPASARTPGTPPSLPPEDPAHGTSAGRNAPGSAAHNLSKWLFFSASQLHDSRLGVPEDSFQPRRCHEAGNGQKLPQTATCFHAQHLDPVSIHDTTSSSAL